MTASIITIAADAIARDFAGVYAPSGTGWRRRNADWSFDIVSDDCVTQDVRAWLDGLEDEGGSNVVALLRGALGGNPGWAHVLAGRVMRQLRDAAVTAA